MKYFNFYLSVSLAKPQLASTTEIPAEAKTTTVFLRTSTTISSTSSSMIKDSVPKLKIDFLSNHCSDFDNILYLKTLCVEPQHDSFSPPHPPTVGHPQFWDLWENHKNEKCYKLPEMAIKFVNRRFWNFYTKA